MKLVINRGKTFAHMGLSHEAIMMWCELKRLEVFPQIHCGDKDFPYGWRKYWAQPIEEIKERLRAIEPCHRSEFYAQAQHNMSEIPRDDEVLIYVVEELKERASAPYASVQVVEIPGGVEWVLMREYAEGPEWIAEKHRTWGKPE